VNRLKFLSYIEQLQNPNQPDYITCLSIRSSSVSRSSQRRYLLVDSTQCSVYSVAGQWCCKFHYQFSAHVHFLRMEYTEWSKKVSPNYVFRSALPLASIRLGRQASPLPHHPIDGNSFNSFFQAPIFSLFSGFQLGFYHLRLFYPYCSFTHNLTAYITSCIKYLINAIFSNNL